MKKLWVMLVFVIALCLGSWAGAEGANESFVRMQIMDSGAYITVPAGTEKLLNTMWTVPVTGSEKMWLYLSKHATFIENSEPAFSSLDFTVTSSTVDGVVVQFAEKITENESEIHVQYIVGKYRYNIDVLNMTTKQATVFKQICRSLSFNAQDTESGVPRFPGDADGNSSVTLADARAILSGNVSSEANADVTGDGKVDTQDVLRIMQYLAGWGVTLQ